MRPFNSKLYIRITWTVLAALAAAFCPAAHAFQSKLVITWGGNAPGWNKKIHLNAIRMGCSSSPAGCVEAAQKVASQQKVQKVFLAMLLNSSSANYAQQYSALSAANPVLYSVGFDDFVSQIERLHTSQANAASMVGQFVDMLKSANPNLHFGVTVYVDELSSLELTAPEMADARNRTDFVHLFIHYRRDGPQFESYVRDAKALFPNAQIIAGSYPVDRIDYLPCSRTTRDPCTSAEELSLFDQTFDLQLHLLQEGMVAGIEFYPGDFGDVEKAGMWREPRSCQPGRLPECIANSKQMQDYAGKELSKMNL